MKLTDARLRSLKATGKTQKFADGGTVHSLSPAGGKLWRLAYRFGGKQKTLALGKDPEISLAEARKRRDETCKMLCGGIDPCEAKKERKYAVATMVRTAVLFSAGADFDPAEESRNRNGLYALLYRLRWQQPYLGSC